MKNLPDYPHLILNYSILYVFFNFPFTLYRVLAQAHVIFVSVKDI